MTVTRSSVSDTFSSQRKGEEMQREDDLLASAEAYISYAEEHRTDSTGESEFAKALGEAHERVIEAAKEVVYSIRDLRRVRD